MELSIAELIGLMLGSGATTGGFTLAGIRVHIQYLREQDKRHDAENAAVRTRLEAVEKDAIILHGMAERAHQRLDKLQAKVSA